MCIVWFYPNCRADPRFMRFLKTAQRGNGVQWTAPACWLTRPSLGICSPATDLTPSGKNCHWSLQSPQPGPCNIADLPSWLRKARKALFSGAYIIFQVSGWDRIQSYLLLIPVQCPFIKLIQTFNSLTPHFFEAVKLYDLWCSFLFKYSRRICF